MATVCAFYKYTPSQYWDLTLDERNALVRVINKQRGK